jgi:tRNA(Leu) C34 or U34 (ribose-2'-O)-methylase TrmL
MPQLFGIELGQTIDVTYFERIARFQGEKDAAIGRRGGAARRTAQSNRRTRTNLIHPSRWIDRRAAARRNVCDARNGLRHGHHHNVQHAILAPENRRIVKRVGGGRHAKSAQREHGFRHAEYASFGHFAHGCPFKHCSSSVINLKHFPVEVNRGFPMADE